MRENNIRPVLAQYAKFEGSTQALPVDCYVDPADSMIRVLGSGQPLIEVLLVSAAQYTSAISTLLTEASRDPTDPDTVRMTDQFVTLITRGEEDPSDPDMVRLYANSAFATLLTKADVDPGDPDTVRTHREL